MLINELLNKDTYIFPEAEPLIILVSKSALCMANNGKDTNHTRNIARRVHFVRNCENCEMHNIECCEGGLHLADIVINNVGETALNPKIKYIMAILTT